MNLFGWLIPDKLKSPETLYKEKKDKEFIEQLKCSAIIINGESGLGFSMTNLGMSEYGADKQIEKGIDPPPHDRQVLLRNGDLVSWDTYKRIKGVEW